MICLLLLAGRVARADVSTEGLSAAELEQRSRAHFELARAHLDLREYDAAIREFQIGYQYKPLPLFLYNIGQVASLAGHRTMALEAYQKYLSVNPRAPERAEVKQRIAELQRNLAADPEPPGSDKLDEPPAAAATNATPPPSVTPEPSTPAASATQNAALTVTATPPPKKKSNKVWIAVGVVAGVLVIGAAVAIGLTQSVHDSSGYNNWGTLVVSGH